MRWRQSQHPPPPERGITCTCTSSCKRFWATLELAALRGEASTSLHWLLQETMSGTGVSSLQGRSMTCTCTVSFVKPGAGSGPSTPEGRSITCTCTGSCREPWGDSGCSTLEVLIGPDTLFKSHSGASSLTCPPTRSLFSSFLSYLIVFFLILCFCFKFYGVLFFKFYITTIKFNVVFLKDAPRHVSWGKWKLIQ